MMLGATTLSITTFSIMMFSIIQKNATLSIMTFNAYTECCNAKIWLIMQNSSIVVPLSMTNYSIQNNWVTSILKFCSFSFIFWFEFYRKNHFMFENKIHDRNKSKIVHWWRKWFWMKFGKNFCSFLFSIMAFHYQGQMLWNFYCPWFTDFNTKLECLLD
jgi:hypothetical protein